MRFFLIIFILFSTVLNALEFYEKIEKKSYTIWRYKVASEKVLESTNHIILPGSLSLNLNDKSLKGLKIIKKSEFFTIVETKENPFLLSKKLVDSGLKWAEPNFIVDIEFKSKPNDPFLLNQWVFEDSEAGGVSILSALNFLKTKNLTSGKGVKVAVIDNGFDLFHEDLNNKFLEGFDIIDKDNIPLFDKDAHGTAVTGIIGAETDNKLGVAGICYNCMIIPIKMSGDLLTVADLVSAFDFAYNAGADVINCSWGPPDRSGAFELSPALFETIKNVAEKGRNGFGIPIVFAAGNGNEDFSSEKSFDGFAAHPNTIAVGAVTKRGRKTTYSDFGLDLIVTAPSCENNPDSIFNSSLSRSADGIWTTDISDEAGYMPGNYDSSFCGTSAAAPIVSGVIALMIGAKPDISVSQIIDIFKETSEKIGGPEAEYDEDGHSVFYGYGRINALKSLEKLCENECVGLEKDSGAPFYREKIEADVDNIINDDNIVRSNGEKSGCSLIVIN